MEDIGDRIISLLKLIDEPCDIEFLGTAFSHISKADISEKLLKLCMEGRIKLEPQGIILTQETQQGTDSPAKQKSVARYEDRDKEVNESFEGDPGGENQVSALFAEDSISIMNLSVRSRNVLKVAELPSVAHLVSHLDELPTLPSCGQASVRELNNALSGGSQIWGFDITEEALASAVKISGSKRYIFDPCGALCRVQGSAEVFYPKLVNDASHIDELGLPDPITKRLKGARLCTVGEVASESYERLFRIKGMGSHKMGVLYEVMEKQAASLPAAKWEEGLDHEFILFPKSKVDATSRCAFSLLAEYDHLLDEEVFVSFCEKEVQKKMQNDSNDMFAIAQSIANAIESFESLIFACVKDIQLRMEIASDCTVVPEGAAWTAAAFRLEGKIERLCFDKESRLVYEKKSRLMDWVETLQEKKRQQLEMRLSGATLQECGDAFGVTRERIRQITLKVLCDRPSLLEDRYRYLFDNYDFTEEMFKKTTGESVQTYHYLEVTSEVKKSEKRKISEVVFDPMIDGEIKEVIKSGGIDEDHIYIGDERIRASKESLVDFLLRVRLDGEPIEVNALMQMYMELLDELGFESSGRLSPTSSRAFNACVQRYTSNVLTLIHSDDNRVRTAVRYIDSSVDFDQLWGVLKGLAQCNMECSAEQLLRYDEVASIVKDIGIKNGYELHSIITKMTDGIEGVVLGRVPMLTLGNSARDDQILALIKEMEPVSAAALARAYEERYGVRETTFLGSFLREFELYLDGKTYRYVHRELNTDESNFLLSELHMSGGYLAIEELKLRYKAMFPNNSSTILNQENVAKFGFKISGTLLVRAELDMRNVFSQLISQHELFDVSTPGFGEAVFANEEFRSVLNKQLRRFSVLEYKRACYMNIGVVESLAGDFTAVDFDDYLNAAIDFMDEGIPYTLKSLACAGFSHRIESLRNQLDVDNRFFESVLSIGYVGNRLKRTSFGGSTVFCKNEGWFSSPQILKYILKEKRPKNLEELVDCLEIDYGIETTPYLVRCIMNRGDIRFEESTCAI